MQNLKSRIFAICFAAIWIASCAGAGSSMDNAVLGSNDQLASDGAPYRFVKLASKGGGSLFQKQIVGVTSKSSADSVLSADILNRIGGIEVANGGTNPPVLMQVRTMDGAPHPEYEIWVIDRAGAVIAYTVSIIPSPAGGSDFMLKGPWAVVLPFN